MAKNPCKMVGKLLTEAVYRGIIHSGNLLSLGKSKRMEEKSQRK